MAGFGIPFGSAYNTDLNVQWNLLSMYPDRKYTDSVQIQAMLGARLYHDLLKYTHIRNTVHWTLSARSALAVFPAPMGVRLFACRGGAPIGMQK